MPQEGLRSAIYRSFVTCNDPKGVVTCRPIRRHKTDNNRDIMMIRQRNTKTLIAPFDRINASESSESREEDEDEEELIHSPASFQLTEVSRGAQKLNEMIESWSNNGGESNDNTNKDIFAKDLLRGAMDLQGSLVMLGKLQEASRFMARLKRERCDKEGSEKPRLSFGGGNGNSTEELKNVVRESLVKQSRLTVFPRDERVQSQKSVASPKGPNLIAKLMGLEDYNEPPRPLRPVSRSVEATPPKVNSERRSLREILEGLHFEELSKENEPIEEGSPIVLIKPLREKEMRILAVEKEVEKEEPFLGDRRNMLNNKLRNGLKREGFREQRAKVEVSSQVKSRADRSVNNKCQSNNGAEKRVDEPRKAIHVHRKPLEKKPRSVVEPKSKDQAIVNTLMKAKKTSSEANNLKNQNRRRSPPSLGPNPKPSTVKRADQKSSPSNQIKNSYKKKEKPVKKSTVTKVIETKGREKGQKRIRITTGSHNHEATIDTNPDKQSPKEEIKSVSESKIEDVNLVSLEIYNDSAEEEASPNINGVREQLSDEKKFEIEPEVNLKAFLLNCPSFRSRADELFELNTEDRTVSGDLHGGARSVLLDCASEIADRLSSSRTSRRELISPEAVAEKVCDEIETLRSYISNSGEFYGEFPGEFCVVVDFVSAILEKDMMSGGGAWNSGWKTAGVSPEEAENVVGEVERLVLFGLIEEIFA